MKAFICRRTKGFTLVELLVVIGIIAVLVSILLPALNRVNRHAQALACASNLKQVGLAWHQYVNANDSWVPPMARFWGDHWASPCDNAYQLNTSPTPGVKERDYRWFHYLYPYTKTYKIFNCPVVNISSGSYSNHGGDTQVKDTNGDGAPNNIRAGYSKVGVSSNYAYAAHNMGRAEDKRRTNDPSGLGTVPTWSYPEYSDPRNLTLLRRQARAVNTNVNQLIVAMDGVYWVTNNGASDLIGAQDRKRYVHPGPRVNVLFVDGHVEPKLGKEIGNGTFGFGAPIIFAK